MNSNFKIEDEKVLFHKGQNKMFFLSKHFFQLSFQKKFFTKHFTFDELSFFI